MYERPALDRYQDLVTASYGSPVNPTQDVTGIIELRNPLDDKVLARVPAGAGDPDISKVIWTEGVDHDDSRIPSEFKGWNSYGNKTTTEHRETPETKNEVEPIEVRDARKAAELEEKEAALKKLVAEGTATPSETETGGEESSESDETEPAEEDTEEVVPDEAPEEDTEEDDSESEEKVIQAVAEKSKK